MQTENQICRLCLNTCDIFETITDDIKETLNKLHLEIDLSKTECPVMCRKCSETIRKWFEFKSTCSQAGLNKRENINRSENDNTCCLCMKIVTPADYFVSLTAEEKSVTSLKIILLKYFDEIDISHFRDPVICASCLENLEGCSTFITSCLEGEEKVKKYCDDNGIGNTDLCHILENKNYIWLKEIKTEEDSTYDASINMGMEGLEGEKIGIKCEGVSGLGLDDQKISIKHEDASEKSPQENVHSAQPSYTCKLCDYHTEDYSVFKKHMISHKSTNKMKVLRCLICAYQTNFPNCLRLHMIKHKSTSELIMYKCTECEFETKWKNGLQRHSLIHKGSDVTMHKCAKCRFETKHKRSLKVHMQKHDRMDKVVLYKCHLCEFQTDVKWGLQKHMLNHRSCSEITMRKSGICEYKTKNLCYVSQHKHVVCHKSSPEVIMHKCTKCSFETACKNGLRQHMIVHKRSSEVTSGLIQNTESSKVQKS